ncbi:d9108652-156c-4e1b-b1d9-7e14f2dad086 [Sclerotinia trifoliorum]|uniref:4a-hydroxytetrahydrobiopterin dehydratase n=1 Tax=Sclerotinia trifoliorum TaxID=28548 RepID=A0A8H2ZRB7_9HELO|nr:d9108652-156c-4e1b-b1d9-7e14f2dad086 [Sclerotinia trifoliorum]
MNLSIRHILRPCLYSFPTLTPRYKTFPKLLPSNAVYHVRHLQLPAVTNSSEEKCSSEEEATLEENTIPGAHTRLEEEAPPESTLSPLTDITSNSSKVPKWEARKEAEHSSDLSYITIQQSLRPLLKENGGKWVLTSDGMGMRRIFTFKGFKDTWNFMNAIAAKCKQEKHHPEWVNIYNKVFIRWTTHDLPGLSSSDILMATFCDEQATIHKEVKEQESQKEASDDIEITKNEEFLNHACEVGNKNGSENPKTPTVTLEKAPTPVNKATATPKEKSKTSKYSEVYQKNKEMKKLQAEEKAMQRTIDMTNILREAGEIRRRREAHKQLLRQHKERREKRERTENGGFLLSKISGGKKNEKLKEERKEKRRIEHQNLMREHEEQKRLKVSRHQERLRRHRGESGLENEATGMKID